MILKTHRNQTSFGLSAGNEYPLRREYSLRNQSVTYGGDDGKVHTSTLALLAHVGEIVKSHEDHIVENVVMTAQYITDNGAEIEAELKVLELIILNFPAFSHADLQFLISEHCSPLCSLFYEHEQERCRNMCPAKAQEEETDCLHRRQAIQMMLSSGMTDDVLVELVRLRHNMNVNNLEMKHGNEARTSAINGDKESTGSRS